MEQTISLKLPLRKRVPGWAKALLQITSFGVCVALLGCLMATAFIADLQLAMSGQNLRNLLTQVIEPLTGQSASVSPVKQPRSGNADALSALALLPYEYDEVGEIRGFTDQNGEFVALPEDIFFHEPGEDLVLIGQNQLTDTPIYVHPVTGENGDVSGFISREGTTVEVLIHLHGQTEEETNLLVDWAYSFALQLLGEDADISKSDIREFIKVSTVQDFIVDKLSDTAESFLREGTFGSILTAEELSRFLQDNKELVQEYFGVELTPDRIDKLNELLEQAMAEGGLSQVIQEMVDSFLASDEPMTIGPVTLTQTPQQLLDSIRAIATGAVLTVLLLICLGLAAVLCGLNFYNLPGGLTWVSAACLVAGGMLSLALLLVDKLTAGLETGALLGTLARSFAPVHYGIFFGGVGLLAVSVLWRVLRSSAEKNRAANATV